MKELILNITRAITNKLPIAVFYKGDTRDICPHLLGETKDGRLVVHGFQFGGGSSKGPVTPETGSWKYFYVDEIEGNGFIVPGEWLPTGLAKTEGDYVPPAFIATVVAMVNR